MSHVLVIDSLSCHLHFLKKNLKNKYKNKKRRHIVTVWVTNGVIYCARFFFSLLISATHVFFFELSPTQARPLS